MIYLSGPITNNPDYKNDFQRAENICRNQYKDVEIFNPVSIGLIEGASWMDYMLLDLAELNKCDSVIFLEGWENSSGCKVEKICAEAMKLKIFYLKNEELICEC